MLDGISLAVNQGEVIALIGASGSGKSTLLRSINLLEMPDGGDIFLEGRRVEYFPGKSAWRSARTLTELRSSVGMVFRNCNRWPHKTVVENVMEAPMMVRGLPRAEADRRAMELLENIGLADKRDELPRRLSGSQQQRVAIARAAACSDDGQRRAALRLGAMVTGRAVQHGLPARLRRRAHVRPPRIGECHDEATGPTGT